MANNITLNTTKTSPQKTQTTQDYDEFDKELIKKSHVGCKCFLTCGTAGGILGFTGGTGFAIKKALQCEKMYRDGRSLEFAQKTVELIEKYPKKVKETLFDMAASDLSRDKNKFKELITTVKQEADNFILYGGDLIESNKFAFGTLGAIGGALIGLGIGAVIHKIIKSKEN